jgi:hypothetical protein
VIDLAALEPTEQFDESMQPPPPPIPDMDLVAPPLPDMQEPIMAEPVMLEVPPRPKKKKKKKKGAAAKAAAGDSAMDKLKALPIELLIFGICAVVFALGMFSSSMAGTASTVLSLVGIGCLLWGHICIVIVAFSEGTVTGLMYMFLPIYPLVFIITHWSDVARHFGRSMLGFLFMIGSIVITGKQFADHVVSRMNEANSASVAPQNLSSDPAFKISVTLESSPEEEDVVAAEEKQVADGILASFKQRGVKPPEGQIYQVEATAQDGMGDAEVLCRLLVKTSGGDAVYDQTKSVTLPEGTVKKAPKNLKGEERLAKQLWKGVPAKFKAMAEEVPLTPGGAAEKPKGDAGGENPAK